MIFLKFFRHKFYYGKRFEFAQAHFKFSNFNTQSYFALDKIKYGIEN